MELKRLKVEFGHDFIYAMDITYTLDELSMIDFALEDYVKTLKDDDPNKEKVKKIFNELEYILYNDDHCDCEMCKPEGGK